jgi:hypothetical protein
MYKALNHFREPCDKSNNRAEAHVILDSHQNQWTESHPAQPNLDLSQFGCRHLSLQQAEPAETVTVTVAELCKESFLIETLKE